MLCAAPSDVAANVAQALALKEAGCDIVRLAIPTMEDIRLISAIKNGVDIPLVADIQFDYRLAIAAVKAGIDKVRINPGNIGGSDRVHAVAEACRDRHIPIQFRYNLLTLRGQSVPFCRRRIIISHQFRTRRKIS